MSPSSASMRPIDSQDSQGSDQPPAPYDDAGPAPPDYASPPLHQGEDDEAPLLLRDKKRQPGQGQPVSVDDFAHEIGRITHDVNALRDIIDGIETLHADLSSHESPLSILEALARRTTSATLLVSTTVPALRALRSTLPFLKPAAGAFVVSNSQTLELKHQLASCARALEGTLEKVAKMERVEEGDGKKESRMRLLKCIKAREGEGVESSELMAQLLGAERDGGRAVAEKLEVDSYAWRWAVERPGCRLARAIDEVGDVTFLRKIEFPPAPSLWANTWAYVPTLYAGSNATARKTSGYSAAGTKESIPIDGTDDEEVATANYGEPLASESARSRPSRYKLWFIVLFMLVVLAASGVGIAFWVHKLRHATAEREGTFDGGMTSTFVNRMPAHPTTTA